MSRILFLIAITIAICAVPFDAEAAVRGCKGASCRDNSHFIMVALIAMIIHLSLTGKQRA